MRVLDQGLALCRASSYRVSLSTLAAGLGQAYALQERLAEGHALVEEAIEDDVRTGGLQASASRVARLSEVCRLAGRSAAAGQYARQALALARQLKEHGSEAHALYQLGAVQAHTDPPMSRKPKPTTSRPWPSPKNSACARWWPIAMPVSTPCIPGQAAGSRPLQHSPRPSPCTVPWR